MKISRRIAALGIFLAVVAMPASAGWNNFYVDSNPGPSPSAPGIPEDDPIDLAGGLTEALPLSLPDLATNLPLLTLQSWQALNWSCCTTDRRPTKCRNRRLSFCSRWHYSQWDGAART